MYAKYTGYFRTPKETSKFHQNSDFLELGDPTRYFCTCGEKEQTSKRVSVIACDNVISKTRFATRTRPRKNLPRNVKNPSNSRRFKEFWCPRGILCTRGEKEYASIRQPTVAYDNRLVKREAYDASPGRVTLLPCVFKIAQENHIFLKSLYLTNIVC